MSRDTKILWTSGLLIIASMWAYMIYIEFKHDPGWLFRPINHPLHTRVFSSEEDYQEARK